MATIEQRIKSIEVRNQQVEQDKAWETSLLRRISIFILTYLILASYMWAIRVPSPAQNAVIPAVGFALSTLALHPIRRMWEIMK